MIKISFISTNLYLGNYISIKSSNYFSQDLRDFTQLVKELEDLAGQAKPLSLLSHLQKTRKRHKTNLSAWLQSDFSSLDSQKLPQSTQSNIGVNFNRPKDKVVGSLDHKNGIKRVFNKDKGVDYKGNFDVKEGIEGGIIEEDEDLSTARYKADSKKKDREAHFFGQNKKYFLGNFDKEGTQDDVRTISNLNKGFKKQLQKTKSTAKLNGNDKVKLKISVQEVSKNLKRIKHQAVYRKDSNEEVQDRMPKTTKNRKNSKDGKNQQISKMWFKGPKDSPFTRKQPNFASNPHLMIKRNFQSQRHSRSTNAFRSLQKKRKSASKSREYSNSKRIFRSKEKIGKSFKSKNSKSKTRMRIHQSLSNLKDEPRGTSNGRNNSGNLIKVKTEKLFSKGQLKNYLRKMKDDRRRNRSGIARVGKVSGVSVSRVAQKIFEVQKMSLKGKLSNTNAGRKGSRK